jgi:alpha-D-ribose 1-methylphosphonate 5-triphosphate diphosphatase
MPDAVQTKAVPARADFAITHARVVTPQGVLPCGSVVVENGRIARVEEAPEPAGTRPQVNAGGRWLLPGLVDIHGDSLERAIAPRPAAPFPLALAIRSHDRTLAVHGITSTFHCVGLGEMDRLTKPLRDHQHARQIVAALNELRRSSTTRCFVHLRYEVLDVGGLDLIGPWLHNGDIDLLSFQDHTPGYGVFKDIEAYRQYLTRSGMPVEAAEGDIRDRLALRNEVDEERLADLGREAQACGVTAVSHDDHTEEKIDWAHRLGITVAEFPVTPEAVEAARRRGMRTVFGAPNLLRGGSHAGNLAVGDLIAEDRADILCSDYAPMALLPALFRSAAISPRPFHEVVGLFTKNPAEAVGLGDRIGTIEAGKAADLILVAQDDEMVRPVRTWVGGASAYAG